MIVDLVRGAIPVDMRLGLVNLAGVGHAFRPLRHEVEAAFVQPRQRFHDQRRTKAHEPVVQLASRHIGLDGAFFN